jgi:hypothetical protein
MTLLRKTASGVRGRVTLREEPTVLICEKGEGIPQNNNKEDAQLGI